MGEENIIENETDLYCPKCKSMIYWQMALLNGKHESWFYCKKCGEVYIDIDFMKDGQVEGEDILEHVNFDIFEDYPLRTIHDYDDDDYY